MSEFVTFLDLPHPPNWFIQSSKKIILDANATHDKPIDYEYTEPAETVVINDKTFYYGEYYRRALLPLHSKWVCENINPLLYNPGVSITTKGDLWPHLDHGWKWSLNYVIDPGGDNVETYWAQERGSPLRPKFQILKYWRRNPNLDEVYSYKVPAKTWVLIPADIIHGTKNQTSDRISISVKLNDDIANELKQKHKI